MSRALALAPNEAAPTPTAVPRFWRPSNLARQFDKSRQAVYGMIQRGELKAIRIDGSLRIAESEVLRYLAEREAGR